MIIEYCQTCGLRIRAADFESGAAVRASEGMAFCPQCRPARGTSSAQRAAALRETAPLLKSGGSGQARTGRAVSGAAHEQAASHAPRSAQPSGTDVRNGIPPKVMVGGGIAALVLLVLVMVLLNGGSTPSAQRTAEKKPLASPTSLPVPPAQAPAERAVVVETPAKKEPATSEPPPKAEGVEDIRESYARGLWRTLKLKAEQDPAALWVTQKELRDFVSGYGSTAAGKEAAEYLKAKALDQPPTPTPERTLADLKADFSPEQPKTGWAYLWNADGEIGRAAHYRPLVWNTEKGSYTGDAKTYPAKGTAHHFVRVTNDGGHPGAGREQKESGGIDRFAIVAYQIPSGRSGKTALTGRLVCGDRNGGVEMRLYVNDVALGALLVRGGAAQEFSTWLGDLKEGDTAYVAVGPNRVDGNDTYGLSFKIHK